MAEQVAEREPRIDEQLQQFLRDFKDENGKDKYRLRLSQLGNAGGTALLIDFDDLIAHTPNIARQLLDNPNAILRDLELAAYAQLKMEDPEYAEQAKTLKLHFRKLPSHEFIRKLGAAQIGHLTAVDGIIVRSTEVHPLLTKGKFQCRKCNATIDVEQNFNRPFMRGPGICAHCRSKIFEFVEKESSYLNSQQLRIQERPEDLPPGQLPQTINVRVIEDLVNTARPGDRVTVTAIVKAQQNYMGRKVALTTFQLELEANYIEVVGKEVDVVELTPEDEHKIVELSKDPFIHRKLIASLAPSIYGYGDIKEGILYLIAGGVAKQLPDGMKLRGDPNILLIGEPAVAKSQLLQYVARVAPRGLYTSGRGTSAAGLTAAVLKDKAGGMVLEAGALVLADKGVACVDEVDKMRPEDRVAMHETLEQHTVCYDDQTELLTAQGWKFFKDVTTRDTVATLTSKGQLKYQSPTRVFTCKYQGDMVAISNSHKVNLLVTPQHKIYASQYRSGNTWLPFSLVAARELVNKRFKIKRSANWHGKEKKYFILPQYSNRYETRPAIKIEMGLFLEFLGYWLSEGSADNYRIMITQKEGKKHQLIEKCLAQLPFRYKFEHFKNSDSGNFMIHNVQLACYFKPLSNGAATKFVPNMFKQLSTRQLTILLEALMVGDGGTRQHTNGSIQRTYYTTSPKLADDVQEILLKTGISGNIRNHHTKGKMGAFGKANYDELDVSFVFKNTPQVGYHASHGSKSGTLKIMHGYDGDVYCVEVPNHILYVRRHGVPVWSGNSIAKAGIVATLNARAAVLAAANPAFGRYDPYKNIVDNINMPITLLSRFDLIFIMKDTPNAEADGRLARHILTLHRTRDTPEKIPITPEMFRKYLSYAKRVVPVLGQEAEDALWAYYMKMRSTTGSEAPIAITARQLESLVRLCEARARLFLRDTVTLEDANAITRLVTLSMQEVGVDVTTGKMDIDVIMSGTPQSLREKIDLTIKTMRDLEKQFGKTMDMSLVIQAIVNKGLLAEEEVCNTIQTLIKNGKLYEPAPGKISLIG
ncbi:MAG: Replicative DNA helicase Mcm [Candidatus Woesebacteria bacterium GW2011_GWB1_39_12]|uniref:DNA helicase n=1 Tax=Candidatus Woesebacteria bacterium GW2011_GWB1_39_12 TaxID=1618574 RepID=A0A0G0MC75_9BACT|nr:MAG: Replicative DNA helicase Mcm [Candidatus Woesebacteria bacterium GW2011_GWB1_39_12]